MQIAKSILNFVRAGRLAAFLLAFLVLSEPTSAQKQDGGDASGEKPSAKQTPQSPQQLKAPNEKGETKSGSKIPSLEEMLTIALKHNPDIRAGEAKLRAAEAELDRTRLEVVQKITAFRQEWLNQKGLLRSARINAEKASEAELPFLLGRPVDRRPREDDSSKQNSGKAALIPILREVLKAALKSYQSGHTDIDRVYDWSRRLMEAERAAADSKSGHVAAVEAHLSLMKNLAEIATAAYRQGQAAQLDVRAAEFYVKEAELLLSQVEEE